MDRWEKPLREDRFRQGRKNPSFSSTLLDAIYRSIDEGEGREEDLMLYKESLRTKQTTGRSCASAEEEMASLRRACMIEKLMEKKVTEKVVIRRKPASDFERKSRYDRNSVLLNSSSSSSDSSCGGGFSSSETDSVYGSGSRSSGLASQRPKSIRTSVSTRSEKPLHYEHREFQVIYDDRNRRNTAPEQKPKHEGGFLKTKSRALKIYGDLKKAKQPVSPGGRLASFLNSLFTAGNAKKAKISTSGCDDASYERKSKSTQASTCSSASSFSRSCLSKTPSSRGKVSNGMKRSVRFCPVSVILDEDCQPCGEKRLYEDEPGLVAVAAVGETRKSSFLRDDLNFHIMEKNRRVEEAARDLLKGYQKKSNFDMRDLQDDDDDDDAASYSSSDLFELDNLAAIGIERYREELPVYETTHLDTNRAIANGLIL